MSVTPDSYCWCDNIWQHGTLDPQENDHAQHQKVGMKVTLFISPIIHMNCVDYMCRNVVKLSYGALEVEPNFSLSSSIETFSSIDCVVVFVNVMN